MFADFISCVKEVKYILYATPTSEYVHNSFLNVFNQDLIYTANKDHEDVFIYPYITHILQIIRYIVIFIQGIINILGF